MPFKSKAQARLFFAKERAGELPEGTARRWAHETADIKKLPEKLSSLGLAHAHDKGKGLDPKAITVGAKVEKEHTRDRETARQIAMDHLRERPDYYARLKKVEGEGEKIADSLSPEETPGLQPRARLLAGAGLVGGGTGAMAAAGHHLHPRTRLYHGTDPDTAAVIQAKGIHPASATGKSGIVDLVIPDDIRDTARKHVYLTPDPADAGQYAGQAELLKERKGNLNLNDPIDQTILHNARQEGVRKGKRQAGVLTADVPLWKEEFSSRVRPNPETRGSLDAFKKHIKETLTARGASPWDVSMAEHFIAPETYKQLNRATVLEGHVPPQFIRGANFRGPDLNEFMQYARARPKSVAKGVALAGGGLAAAAGGARLLSALRHPTEKAAALEPRDPKLPPLQGHLKFQGLSIAIENKKGSIRKWYDDGGKVKGQTTMRADYGYIENVEGADGEELDVYVGPAADAKEAYVIDQRRAPDFKEFDEQKIMLGFNTPAEAAALYNKQYNDPRFLGAMKAMPMNEFKSALKTKGAVRIKMSAAMYGAVTGWGKQASYRGTLSGTKPFRSAVLGAAEKGLGAHLPAAAPKTEYGIASLLTGKGKGELGHRFARGAARDAAEDAGSVKDVLSRIKKAEEHVPSLADRIDDVGIGVLAVPAAASLVGHGLSALPHAGMANAGKRVVDAMHHFHAGPGGSAAELAGLALVAPSIAHAIARRVEAPKTAGALGSLTSIVTDPRKRRNAIATATGLGALGLGAAGYAASKGIDAVGDAVAQGGPHTVRGITPVAPARSNYQHY